ncbi:MULTISPECIES: serine/threonine-protein kinase [unclassified Streptomyces]|uniref:serine/threonine-protein kinase n=1 Tax=unclassified Streptomyces TaxID=2593676 RepID=UPI002E7FC082|nr:serine/threonine-protein kinase [Streptomyces sp. NBC_00589]WTI41279.1 serine/threonine protein kinase [Streptomyces sp. NBC_00775]WUB25037.1 serine/threonine protein kinase [Streptomyces sp. NBC_00589]
MFQPLEDDDPRTAGEYRLLARLGAGGMGCVYLSHTPGGRAVAVKVIRPELADDPDFRDRFRQEVANARRVQGVCTVPVLDSDTEGPMPWLATAYIPGPSLADAVKEHGPLPRDTVLLLTAGVAEALQDIHRAGVVHRDLKPSNVLLAFDGPRVIDFGVARAADATALTRSGSAIGTPAFMAPEQALGGEITGATDVFALGQIAAFAATGAGAFGDGPSHGVLYRIVHEEPRLGELPDYLAELVAGCLHKDPALRPSPADVIRLCAAADPERGLRRVESWLPASVAGQLAQHAVREPQPQTQGQPQPQPQAQEQPSPVDTMALRIPRQGALGQRAESPAPGVTSGEFGPPVTPFPSAPGVGGVPGGAYAGMAAPGPVTPGGGVPYSAPTGPVLLGPAPRRRTKRRGLVTGGAVVLTVAAVTGALFLSGVLSPEEPADGASGQAGQASRSATEQQPTGSGDPSASPSKKAKPKKADPSASATRTAPPASDEPATSQTSAAARKPTATAAAQPATETYTGIRMTASHDLYLGDRPPGPKADTGTSDEDFTYAVYSSGAVVAPGSTSQSQLTRLAPRAAGTLDSCLAQTGSEKYLWVRDLAVGDRLCVVSGTGHVGLITFRGTAPSPDTTDYITVDIKVWRNAVDPVSG